jgi:hypothetical protein
METGETSDARRSGRLGRGKVGKFLVGLALGVAFMGAIAAARRRTAVPSAATVSLLPAPALPLPVESRKAPLAPSVTGAGELNGVDGQNVRNTTKSNSSVAVEVADEAKRMKSPSALPATSPRKDQPKSAVPFSTDSGEPPSGKERLVMKEAETTLRLPSQALARQVGFERQVPPQTNPAKVHPLGAAPARNAEASEGKTPEDEILALARVEEAAIGLAKEDAAQQRRGKSAPKATVDLTTSPMSVSTRPVAAARLPSRPEMERACEKVTLEGTMPPSFCSCEIGEFEQMECRVSVPVARN